MNRIVYEETFDDGPGGWYSCIDNFKGLCRLPIHEGIVHCYGPWWVDYNHAPPGAGYLNLLMGLSLKGPLTEAAREIGGPNRFIQGGYPTNFTNAKFTFRIKGEIERQGSQLVLLVQGISEGIYSCWVLTGQPIAVTRDWSEQVIITVPESQQWMALGSRHDRKDMYGTVDLGAILKNVILRDCSIITEFH